MYKNKKIVAIIPARKGSKGVKDKNIKELGGIPLVEHTINHAKNSHYIDKIIVSTDSQDIINIANKYEVFTKGLRPYCLSDDKSTIYDVIKYEINNHDLIKDNYFIIILLQPTSPLRSNNMIDKAIKKFIDFNYESAVGVSLASQNPILMRSIDSSGQLVKLLNMDSTVRRQDFHDYYIVNGSIYINKINEIYNGYVSLNDNLSPIIIPKEYDIDIDTIEDFKIAERMLEDLDLREK